jgi:CRP-like cAMP-binding protein
MANTVQSKIQQFFQQYPERDYPKGQIVIHANEPVNTIYYLEAGRVRQYDVSYRGDEIVVNVYKQGAFFSMLHVLTGLENRYFFESAEPIIVRSAPAAAVIEFVQANPDVLFDLMRRVYLGMDGVLQRMAHLMGGSAKSRVLFELLIESRRFGVPEADGSILLKVTQAELGARSGLSRESVTREIHKLKAAGLVDVTSRGIVITDFEKLKDTLGDTL